MIARAPRLHRRTEAARSRLRLDIASGRYSGQDMLPGERDLAASLAVSRTTLRRLLSDLVSEGLLRHRQGIGTFILGGADPLPRVAPRPARLLGLAEEMSAQGLPITTVDIRGAVAKPTPEEAMMLACSPEETVVRLLRLRLADGQPLALERAAVPCRYLGRPDAVGASLYATLDRLGFPPVRALQRLQAGAIGPAEAVHLGVTPGSPGLVVQRTAYLENGACCEFTRSAYPGGCYDRITESLARSRP